MRFRLSRSLARLISWPLALPAGSAPWAKSVKPAEDILVTSGEIGSRGGQLVASLRADPKTLNPVTGVDLPSRELIALLSST